MASMLGDGILLVHFLFIVFVLVGQACILIGGFRHWSWVRKRIFRVAHLIAIGIVALQSWVGVMCPLTILENSFRRAAGETAYPGSFVGYWLSRLVYYDAPQWAFTAAYTLFGLLVLVSWFLVKPERKGCKPPR